MSDIKAHYSKQSLLYCIVQWVISLTSSKVVSRTPWYHCSYTMHYLIVKIYHYKFLSGIVLLFIMQSDIKSCTVREYSSTYVASLLSAYNDQIVYCTETIILWPSAYDNQIVHCIGTMVSWCSAYDLAGS
jgi:hypothetical protein